MLGFHGDALLLSGPAGTGLKTRILGKYFEFWWLITSGGKGREYGLPTAIVDMNAGTGELYIKEIRRTILGSAGHALSLKFDRGYPTEALNVILVEEDPGCFSRLERVIRKRWPRLPIDVAAGPFERNDSGVYLLNLSLEAAIDTVERLNLGNSMYFFDPLLHVEWETIERVATSRIRRFFQPGTEFVIFLFTSDWFTGREYAWREALTPLPSTSRRDAWTRKEAESVAAANSLFGDEDWQRRVLIDTDRDAKQNRFIDEYRKRLMRWFRWVLPLPFIPKRGQLYHLVFCSNFEDGVKVTRDFYCNYTGNQRYNPDNEAAYANFIARFPETARGLWGSQRPVQWKILWHIIRNCEGGVCDHGCIGIKQKGDREEVKAAMRWLTNAGYLRQLEGVSSAWPEIPRYELDWGKVDETLDVSAPAKLEPITPEYFRRRQRRRRRGG
jgi:three-Cys-motif partner protein